MSPVEWEPHAIDSEEEDSDIDKCILSDFISLLAPSYLLLPLILLPSLDTSKTEDIREYRATVVRLTEMLAAQKEHTQALQEELADLTLCYTAVKEESAKAYASLQANERLLRGIASVMPSLFLLSE